MNPAVQADAKLAAAPLDYRLALTFTPAVQRAPLTALLSVYLEIREVPAECRDPGVAELKLAWWQQEVEALYAAKPRHPLTQSLAPHMAALAGRKELFLDVVAGTRMDVAGSTPANYEDVKRYCYRHSGALAELSALLLGARSGDSLLAARLMGNSHRLAYLATAGVREALHGRVYFAAEDIRAQGLDQHMHAANLDDAKIKALLREYAGRMRAMRAEALATLPAAERAALLPWRVLSALGLRRVDKLQASGFKAGAEALELQPLSALFTAWRAARKAG